MYVDLRATARTLNGIMFGSLNRMVVTRPTTACRCWDNRLCTIVSVQSVELLSLWKHLPHNLLPLTHTVFVCSKLRIRT